jgi:ABC-type hemin transport system substrate-binding protein
MRANLRRSGVQPMDAQQIKDALDKIAKAKDHPEQIQQLVNDAKAKVDQLEQSSQQQRQR